MSSNNDVTNILNVLGAQGITVKKFPKYSQTSFSGIVNCISMQVLRESMVDFRYSDLNSCGLFNLFHYFQITITFLLVSLN